MRRIMLIGALTLAAVALAAGPAAAAGKSDSAPGPNKDALVFFYSVVDPTSSPTPSGTVDNLGLALAAGYFGNTSNDTTSGHGVVPSVAPGPATGNCAGVAPGASIGYAITGNGPTAVGKTDGNPC